MKLNCTFAAVAALLPCLVFADFALKDATVVYCDAYEKTTGSESQNLPFGRIYKDADGAQVDLNNYEIWISFKFNEDWFAFDRVVLKRVKK